MLLVDMQQDAAVAAAHHQQGDHIQRDKVKHVVKRLLPAVAEAAVSCTLSEVDGLHPNRSEDKQLYNETQSLMCENVSCFGWINLFPFLSTHIHLQVWAVAASVTHLLT